MEPLTERTLGLVLERSVRLYFSKHALGFVDERPLTFEDLQKEVIHLREFLREEGIPRGDRVIGRQYPFDVRAATSRTP